MDLFEFGCSKVCKERAPSLSLHPVHLLGIIMVSSLVPHRLLLLWLRKNCMTPSSKRGWDKFNFPYSLLMASKTRGIKVGSHWHNWSMMRILSRTHCKITQQTFHPSNKTLMLSSHNLEGEPHYPSRVNLNWEKRQRPSAILSFVVAINLVLMQCGNLAFGNYTNVNTITDK